MADIYKTLKEKTEALWRKHRLLSEAITIKARALSPEEAIGNPDADDYPIQKGKEKLMQADFKGIFGQAFTDRAGDFNGTLNDIIEMPIDNNYRRSVFIAAINSVCRHLNLIDRTIHCKDEQPVSCAAALLDYVKQNHKNARITQIGFQPRMAQVLSPSFAMRLIDLDQENIGTNKFNITIEGPEATSDAIDWCDLLLVTGSTIVNGTIGQFIKKDKPAIFYGTTIAGPAFLLGLNRFCAESS